MGALVGDADLAPPTPVPVVRYTLVRFTPKESRAYIDHRLAQAATEAEVVFTPRALTRLIKASLGP
jgi:type II secretory pathway predicted ATPase ExeA